VGETLVAPMLLFDGPKLVLIEAEIEQASPPLVGASLLALVCVRATTYATCLSSLILCSNQEKS
jgi:hypothetical protein